MTPPDLTRADGPDLAEDPLADYADSVDDPFVAAPAPTVPARLSPRTLVQRGIAVVALLVLGALGYSIGGYLGAPGTDSTAARLAGWARDYHLGGLVNELERIQYDLNKPKTGGTPDGGIPTAAARKRTKPPALVKPHTAAPAPVTTLASPALAGEGQWQTLLTVKGFPAVRAAYIRPDAQHTSYLTGIAWMDQKLARFVLHPGTDEPGGSGWAETASITPPQQPGLLAAFNSGFKLDGARGGYYAEGRTVRPLRVGAASIVLYKDGHIDIAQWGRDVVANPNVSAVRQNLDLLVDNGVLAEHLGENNTGRWGYTLGNVAYVWRSGVGITKTGAIVYAAGNSLSVQTLAQVLQAAGAVRAMELDINPEWTTYYWYEHPVGLGDPTITPHKLKDDMQKPADRYLHTSARDFFAVYARP